MLVVVARVLVPCTTPPKSSWQNRFVDYRCIGVVLQRFPCLLQSNLPRGHINIYILETDFNVEVLLSDKADRLAGFVVLFGRIVGKKSTTVHVAPGELRNGFSHAVLHCQLHHIGVELVESLHGRDNRVCDVLARALGLERRMQLFPIAHSSKQELSV